jgi:hypothetical protein
MLTSFNINEHKPGSVIYREDMDNLHIPGAKEDSAKPDLDLVLGSFSNALVEVGKLGTFGANKYSRNGWKVVENGIRRYSSALFRHWFLESEGEKIDPETDLHHATAVAWNALARLQLILEEEKRNEYKD